MSYPPNQPPYNPAPGFVLPPAAPQQPAYPGYPSYPAAPVQHNYPQPAYGQPFSGPVQQQPGQYNSANDWSSNSTIHDYLVNATTFRVKQKTELLEILTGWEQANRYSISDQTGRKIMYAAEEQNCCQQVCCGACRAFIINVKDANGKDLLKLERGLDCACCFSCLFADKLVVSTPSGQVLGRIVERCDILYPKYDLLNASGGRVLKSKGPLMPCSIGCLTQPEFKIFAPGGSQVGAIGKKWGGIVTELFTDADTFEITFPANLDTSMKAVCLGLVFLIVSTFHFLSTPLIQLTNTHHFHTLTGLRIL